MPLPEAGTPASFEEMFLDYVDREIATIDKHVLNGSCPTHEKYMWHTGQRIGLSMAKQCFQELVSQWENR
jgi:hypothetical protein